MYTGPDGKQYARAIGTRQEVWAGTAHRTSGGLMKKDLFASGSCIKSRVKSAMAKKRNHLGEYLQRR